MRAVITGASSGLGRDFARLFHKMGYDLVLVARRRERMEELQREFHQSNPRLTTEVLCLDLAKAESCFQLIRYLEGKPVDVFINNAGFGVFGRFDESDLSKELEMLDVNIRAVHILTKRMVQKMEKQGRGYILNVASSAGFMPGPLLASYYASKAYVIRLTHALYEELRRKKSRVSVSVLCPGPVNTEFNDRAGVRFAIRGLNSFYVAAYALEMLFEKKLTIIPGVEMKAGVSLSRFVPTKLLLRITYRIQKRKNG